MRLFLDADVLFSACWSPDGRSALLLRLGFSRRVDLVTSPHALTEVVRNLEIKRPEALKSLDQLSMRLKRVPEASSETVTWAAGLGLPPEDAPILAAAVGSGSELLVSGDRAHFGPLRGKRHRGVLVLTPRDALERLLDLDS